MATLVYDDDCGFCTWWAEFFADHADVALLGFSEMGPAVRERLPENYEECAHLLTDDEVYSCGESIEQAFLNSDICEASRPAVEVFRQCGAYDDLREGSYRWVADNRALWGTFLSKNTS